jgi:hypothetical protein
MFQSWITKQRCVLKLRAVRYFCWQASTVHHFKSCRHDLFTPVRTSQSRVLSQRANLCIYLTTHGICAIAAILLHATRKRSAILCSFCLFVFFKLLERKKKSDATYSYFAPTYAIFASYACILHVLIKRPVLQERRLDYFFLQGEEEPEFLTNLRLIKSMIFLSCNSCLCWFLVWHTLWP